MNIFALALKEKQKKMLSRIVPDQRKRLSEMTKDDETLSREDLELVATCRGNPYLHPCPILRKRSPETT